MLLKSKFLLLAAAVLSITACNDDSADKQTTKTESGLKELTVGVCPGPYGIMLQDTITESLKDKGYELKIIEFTDYVQPDQALDSGEIDANLMQHQAYLDAIVKNQGLKLTSVTAVPTLGMGVFSDKFSNLDEITPGSSVAIATDAVNLARSLRLLQDIGLITLKDNLADENKINVSDVKDNPLNLEFVVMEAAQISRSFDSIGIGLVPGNYAIAANLDYTKALGVEKVAPSILNVVTVQNDHVNDIGALLKDLVRSENFVSRINGDSYYAGFTRPDWWQNFNKETSDANTGDK